MTLNLLIRKAIPSEIETLADIAFVAWERDLLPFLHGPAASREAERNRLSAAVRDGLDRIIVAEVNDVSVGWCQRARGKRVSTSRIWAAIVGEVTVPVRMRTPSPPRPCSARTRAPRSPTKAPQVAIRPLWRIDCERSGS